jgi:hypothetical protein
MFSPRTPTPLSNVIIKLQDGEQIVEVADNSYIFSSIDPNEIKVLVAEYDCHVAQFKLNAVSVGSTF